MPGASDPDGPREERDAHFGPGSSADAIRVELSVSVDGRIFPGRTLSQGEYVIGNHPTSDLQIEAPEVGRRHARLIIHAYEMLVERLGVEMVYVDGVAVELPTRFHPDQEIQVGHARIRLTFEPASRTQLAAALWDTDLGLDQPKAQLTGKKYRIANVLGEGGMGIVMEARDQRIRRSVAMKVMRSGQQFSKENVLRFIDEAQLTGQLEHPNIVPVYELGVDDDGHAYYTMKRVQGTTLKQVLRGLRAGKPEVVAAYPLAHLLTILQKVSDAVAFAHSRQVIHRDLKPSNIMIGDYGEVLVMDWGLAKVRGSVDKIDPKRRGLLETARAEAGGVCQTMHGVILGTPPYIAPEQAKGHTAEIDQRTDIYVLGAILYTILALRRPVEGDDIDEVLGKIIAGDIVAPYRFNKSEWPDAPPEVQAWNHLLVHCPNGKIPRALSAVAMKALETRPEDRYQTVEEFQRDLEAYQDGFATTAEQAGLATQLALLFHRHRALFLTVAAGLLLVLLVIAGAALGIYREQNQALRTVRQALEKERVARAEVAGLRGGAPTLIEDAQSLIVDGKFDPALKKITAATSEVPNDPYYHRLRGNMLQSQFRFEQAERAYRRALDLDPEDGAAAANLLLSRELKTSKANREDLLLRLQLQMRGENRFPEALALLSHVPRDPEIARGTWQEYLAAEGFTARLTTDDAGRFILSLKGEPQPDLRFLRRLPISILHLQDMQIRELEALEGLKIEELTITRSSVADLAPLSKLPIKRLRITWSAFPDLRGLAGLKLEELDLTGTETLDLQPLAGMPLHTLLLDQCANVTDLAPLKGMPLRRLGLRYTAIESLEPLRKAPIEALDLEGCRRIFDFSPLDDLPNLPPPVGPQPEPDPAVEPTP